MLAIVGRSTRRYLVLASAEAVERELDHGHGLDQLHGPAALAVRAGRMVFSSVLRQLEPDQRFVQRLRSAELEHAVNVSGIPLAGDDRVEFDIGPVIHQDAGCSPA